MLLPEWITDSVSAGHRLPLEDYSLSRIRDRPGQKALTGFTPQKATRSVAELQAVPSMGLPKVAELQKSQLPGPDVSQYIRPILDLSLDSFEQRSRCQGDKGLDEGPAQRPPGSLAGLVGLAKKLQQAQDARLQGPGNLAHQRHEYGAQQQTASASADGPDDPHAREQNREADQQRDPEHVPRSPAATLPASRHRELADKSATEDGEDGQAEPTEVPQEGILQQQWSCSRASPELAAAHSELARPGLHLPSLSEAAGLPQEEHHRRPVMASSEPGPASEPSLEQADLPRSASCMAANAAGMECREVHLEQQHSKQHEGHIVSGAPDDTRSEQCQTPAAAGCMCRADGAGSASAQPLHWAESTPSDPGTSAEGGAGLEEKQALTRQPSRHLDVNMPMEVIAQDTSQQAAELYAAKARQRCDLLRGPPRSSRDDPAFQQTYFSASRLHFIGSWKARNEALLLGMVNEGPKPSTPPRGGSRTIVHIDMDCFFASVAGVWQQPAVL